jgi:hypothetical protein
MDEASAEWYAIKHLPASQQERTWASVCSNRKGHSLFTNNDTSIGSSIDISSALYQALVPCYEAQSFFDTFDTSPADADASFLFSFP